MFGPKLIEAMDSKFSGQLRVLQGWGYKYIATGILTQTGGLVKDVWEPVLKSLHSPKGKTWLILGLAAGTVAEMISKKYHPQKMTGVEIDPAMITLGKKYFALDKISNLEIITHDADDFLQKTTDHFDYILVDLYLGDRLPGFVYSPKFLKRLKLLSSVVIINHLFYDDIKKANAEKLVTGLKTIFPKITLKRVLTNLMVICEA
jgi:spermidine synthase